MPYNDLRRSRTLIFWNGDVVSLMRRIEWFVEENPAEGVVARCLFGARRPAWAALFSAQGNLYVGS